MTAQLIRLPDLHQDFHAAREVLHSRAATRDQIIMACDVLSASSDWMDIDLVRMMRNALWANRASELWPEARELAGRLSIGNNAALFEALNRRRQFDRRLWILGALATAGMIAMAVL